MVLTAQDDGFRLMIEESDGRGPTVVSDLRGEAVEDAVGGMGAEQRPPRRTRCERVACCVMERASGEQSAQQPAGERVEAEVSVLAWLLKFERG